MSIKHAFSNTQIDAALTVTVWNGLTTASVAATDLVRPSDWNSGHNQLFTLSGNTNNASTVSGTNVILEGAGAVTLVGSNSVIKISSPQFTNSNNITFGTSNNGLVTASFDPINIGMSTNGNTAGTTGTFDGAGLQYIFAGGNNVTLSQSSNGASVTLSIVAAGGGAGATLSGVEPYIDMLYAGSQQPNGTLHVNPVSLPNVQFDRIVMPLINSNSSNSSGSHSLSFWAGIYSRNASTLSLIVSASNSTAITHSGTAGSYSLFSGLRLYTIPMTTTLAEGNYFIGLLSFSSSAGTGGSYSQMLLSQFASNLQGLFGAVPATSVQFDVGKGHYSASTTGMPTTIGLTQIVGTNNLIFRPPVIMFASSTL